MPGYKGHLTGGFIAFGLTYAVLTSTQTITVSSIIPVIGWLMCTLAGALFPDIDTKSKGQNYFYWLVLALLVYFTYQNQLIAVSYVAIAATLPMLVKHRGIFHNVWFLIVTLGALSYLLITYMPKHQITIITHSLFFLVGTVSHLWLDLGFRRMLKIR